MIRGKFHKWFQSYLVKLLLRDNESKWSFVYECVTTIQAKHLDIF